MGHVIIAILSRISQIIVMGVMQWRSLHAQTWGWGPDEQPRLLDEMPSTTDLPSRHSETHSHTEEASYASSVR